MPSSFLSKFVKPPQNANQSPYKSPSPSRSKRSLKSQSSSTNVNSSVDLPKPQNNDIPKFVLTRDDTGASPDELVPESPGSMYQTNAPPLDGSDSVRHRRAVTLAVDDRDLPTPTENEFRLPNHARSRTTSVGARMNGASTESHPSRLNSAINTPTSTNEPPTTASTTGKEQVTSSGQDDDYPTAPNVIVESPEPIKPIVVDDPISPQVLPQSDKEGDTISVASSDGKKKKSQVWRSTSQSRRASAPPRKPSGIAGALAASGLAMANPAGTISVPHSIQQALPPVPSKNRPASTSLTSASTPSFPQTPSDTRSRHRDASVASLASAASANSRYSKQHDIHEEDDDDDSDGYESPDLDLNDDDIPVTGFAVASHKRNADFHELFKSIPEGDYLIDDYGCALQREILIQGRMYISENHVCFHANIFGWITDLTVPMYDIISMEKRTTAFVIPNAIQITTRKAKYSFASFLARDTVFDVMHNIWRTARPDVSSLDGVSARASLEEVAGSTSRLSVDGLPGAGLGETTVSKKSTQCECGRKGEHYSEKALECVLPGTPDKVYTLMFQSAFMKEFMREDQKLQDIQISDWTPGASDPKLLTRNMSYIKPLNGSIGPKQTKCEIRDETVHLDFEDFVSTVTTTQTPDVPSGGVFSVKTRTCLMWAGNNSTRVIVTTAVEWTGRSFIKALIERSAIEGQKTYHGDLERHLKKYIASHITEFVPEGTNANVVAAETETLVESPTEIQPPKHDETRRPPDRRGLQWALDTFTGAYKVGKQSANGAIELLRDAWDTSSSTSLLYALIVVLVASNIYTFLMVGRREEIGRQKAEGRKNAEREQWIADTVKVLLQEVRETPSPVPTEQPLPTGPANSPILDADAEVLRIRQTLDDLEQRIITLRSSLNDGLD